MNLVSGIFAFLLIVVLWNALKKLDTKIAQLELRIDEMQGQG